MDAQQARNLGHGFVFFDELAGMNYWLGRESRTWHYPKLAPQPFSRLVSGSPDAIKSTKRGQYPL